MSPMRTLFSLEPLDTLLFRDGRPFEQMDEGLTEATSLFPPFPSVVAGALRASLARNNGWNGKGRWAPDLEEILGSGPYCAGLLHFGPPIILNGVSEKNPYSPPGFRPLFPCPSALVGCFNPEPDRRKKPEKVAVARPVRSAQRLKTDLNLREGQFLAALDVVDRHKFQTLDGWLIGEVGLKNFLRGERPNTEDLSQLKEIVPQQLRVGLQRDYGRHGAVEGMLYAASHARPQQRRAPPSQVGAAGPGRIAIGVTAELSQLGAKGKAAQPEATLPLGSQGRAVSCSIVTGAADESVNLANLSVNAKEMVSEAEYLHYSLVLLSPALPRSSPAAGARGLELPHGGHEIVSAVIPKPVVFSGWDGVNRQPAPMRRYFAPGSTWYLRFKGKPSALQWHLDKLIEDGISKVGATVGFGAVVIGTWRFAEGTSS